MAKPLTVTLNEHVACRACASFAAQLTVVVPSEKVDPDTGVQVVVTGAAPLLTVGAEYVTACDVVVTPLTLTSTGQAICGAVVVGPVGPPGAELEPHAAAATKARAVARRMKSLEAILTSLPSAGGEAQGAGHVVPQRRR